MMKYLILGATGATGRLLAQQLLDRGQQLKVVVRSAERLPEAVRNHANCSVVEASFLDLNDEEIRELVSDCDGVASCLGHNISFKGIYGKPRRLVTDAVRRSCEAIIANKPENQIRFALLNTTGNRNRDLNEPIPFGNRIVISLLRLLLPPHPDNEQAAEYLRVKIGQNNPNISWVAARPDGLIDEDEVSEYTLHESPTRNPIFDAGKTSRINLAHFMAGLLTNNDLWAEWAGRMPVIYNRNHSDK